MPRLQFTPWKESSELLSVRNQFYPAPSYEGPDMRAKACSQVWVWKLRGNLPHPVEATALLTDAILHDDASKSSVFSIRATYSAAFCRFVTGLVDSKLYGPKQSMYQKAMNLGLPASFVELRHEATHRELPSLIVLRNAVQRSLDWLWEFYWAGLGEVATVEDSVEPCENERYLKETIRNALRPVALKINGSAESVGKKKVSRQVVSLHDVPELAFICSQQHQVALAQIFVERDMLAPANLIENKMDVVFSVWNDFLLGVSKRHSSFLTALVEEMASLLVTGEDSDRSQDPYCEGIYLWIGHILNSSTWAKVRKQLLTLSYIAAICEHSPGYWSDRLRELLDREGDESGALGGSGRAAASDAMEDAGPSAPQSQAKSSSHLGDMESDGEVLRDFGWSVQGDWKFKPIGIV
ncbi:hypothetical protein AJ80_08388 [Polytolypa hystricis UAMH7299]|uniref:Cell morphogenesis protein Las1 n=1 Tax=Polytolypa hystricis (strain UAMH7299) TaxID=1447883 RepID=A0A2B7X8U7_POLH7|nr:hypothetical protein AJ80_08388 [Polytolypa hystricis UAMH7299]